jgi:hypothetical protein
MSEKYAGIGDAAVEKATGKCWHEWIAILDALGAREMAHKAITEALRAHHQIDDWWAQMVTVGYEQARGLRKVWEKADGFAASISRTVNVKLTTLYEAFADEQRLRESLHGAGFTVSKATRDKSMRLKWEDGTRVAVNFYAKGENKSQVTIEHEKLKTLEQVPETKARWKAALDDLNAYLSKLG